ncbi:MAG: hypothetical protein ACE5GN_04305, partial [Waddliaceae bacterium]
MSFQKKKKALKKVTPSFLAIFILFSITISPFSTYAESASTADTEGLWNHYSLFSIVRALAIEGDILWVGTSNGILSYNLVTQAQQVYTTKDGLLSNMIHSITIGPDQVKWVGTYGGGLSRFDGNQWTAYTPYGVGFPVTYGEGWKSFQIGKGLGDLWVYGVHFDPKGIMWIATWKGVSRFDGKKFKTYTTDDGLIDKWVY